MWPDNMAHKTVILIGQARRCCEKQPYAAVWNTISGHELFISLNIVENVKQCNSTKTLGLCSERVT